MPKEEWGVKRLCPSCGSKFYDLQRDPMTCPSCGSSFDLESLLAAKRGGPAARPIEEKKKPLDDLEDEVVLDDDADVDLDDDILDDDEDDDVSLEDIADVAKEDDEN